MTYAVILAGLLSLATSRPLPQTPVHLQGGVDSLNMSQAAFYGGFGGIGSIAVDPVRGYLFGARSAAVDVWDLAQPDNPSLITEIQLPEGAGRLAYRATDQVLFVATRSDLVAVDVSDPFHPMEIGRTQLPAGAIDIALSGNLVVLTLGDSGVAVVNAVDPVQPVLTGRVLLQPDPYTTDGAQKLAVLGTQAYVTGNYSVAYVVDFSTPASPTQADTFLLPNNAADLEVVGNLLAVVTSSTTGGLLLYDVSTPQAPVQVGQYVNQQQMITLVAEGSTVYLAYGSNPPGVDVVDISTPAAPSSLGSFTLSSGWFISQLNLYSAGGGGRLYAAANDGVHVVDVSDPANMSETAVFGNDRAMSVTAPDLAGTRLYVGGYFGNLEVLDLVDPLHPQHLGYVGGNYLWVKARSPNVVFAIGIPDQFSPIQLMVYDFSNPAQPVQLSSMVTSAYDAILAGSRLYGWWADTVDVLDVSNPAQPTHLGASALSGQVEAVFPFRGDTLLVVIYGNGSPHVLKFLDATQPGAMQEGAAVTQSDNGFIRDVQVIGDTLLVVRDSLLEIWDVSNPAASTLLGSYDFGQGDPRRLNTIAFQGHRLVAVAMHVGSPYSDTGAVKLLDITQPGQPQVVAFYEARDFYPQWVHFQVDGQGNLRTLVLNSWDYRVFSVAPTAVAERSVRGELGLLPRVMRGAMRFPAGVRGKITVLDALGREVLSRSVRGGRPVPLRPGVYFWRLERDRQVYQGRVLILP